MIPQRMLTRRQFLAGATLLLLPSPTSAQGTPVTPAQDAISSAVMLDQLPGKRVNALFARHVFEARGQAPVFDRVGSALLLVGSGSMTLTSDGPVTLRRVGQPGPVAPGDILPGGVQLSTGDAALVPHGQRMSLANDSEESASLLMLVAHAPYHQFSYVPPTALPGASGVTTAVIGYGTGAFDEVPAIMLIERDVVPPGGSAYSSTFEGTEIGGIESGSARATFRSGTGWTTKGALENAERPILQGDTRLAAGAIVELALSDGYVSHNGAINWRATGDGPLVVLRAQLIPVPHKG